MKYRENRELRALDRVISLAYYLGWAVTAALLIGLPALRILPGDMVDRSFTIAVPASVSELNTTVVAEWEGRAEKYTLNDVHGDVEIPVTVAPVSLLMVTWLAWAVTCGLTLLMLYHARGLVRRVRAGAPFDAENAIILRRLGLLLLVQYIVKAFYVFGVSSWLVSKLASSSVPLSTAPYANWSVLLSALVLMVLAEIFRRGTALEHEQSLVV
jgi:vacuolar-type H+-ATPase subunit I/STV1